MTNDSAPGADRSPDPERQQAEQQLQRLRHQYAPGRQHAAAGVLADPELARELAALRKLDASRRAYVFSQPTPLQRTTLAVLATRLLSGLPGAPHAESARQELIEYMAVEHGVDRAVIAAGGLLVDERLAEYLDERYGLSVAVDGLVVSERLTAEARAVIGDLSIALTHHTATALLPAIRAQGLRVGAPTNFFNTQAGVYLSTMTGGEPVDVYSRRAARVHGGEPVALRVRRRLHEITPDPDDADLEWAQGRQYVTPSVPAEDLCELRAFEPRLVMRGALAEGAPGDVLFDYEDGVVSAVLWRGRRPGEIDLLEFQSSAPGQGRTRQALHWLSERFGAIHVLVDEARAADDGVVSYCRHMAARGLIASATREDGVDLLAEAQAQAKFGRPAPCAP